MSIKNNIEIKRLDDEGRGIGYIDGKIIFIPNTLPGEVVNVNIIKEYSSYNVGKVDEYIKYSDKREIARCPYYNLCGGCSLQHMSYEDSIEYKTNKFKNILNKFAGIDKEIKVIKNNKEFYYRNKIELKVINGKWGYYNSYTHDFVSINKCFLAKDSINIFLENRELIDIKNGSIIIRCNYDNEILLVINTLEEVEIKIDELKTRVKIVGIVINDKCIYGNMFFIERYNNKFFKVNYNSFFQVNDFVTNEMIEIIKDNSYGNILLDLYCGVGFLGQCVSDQYEKIYGIEINENSVLDAVYNAGMNKIENAYYICDNCSNSLLKIDDNIDTLLIDPPRSGLVKNMVNDVLEVRADRIIYVSCNPISLARDLKNLSDYYNVDKIYLLDMFSNTYHFESIVILDKK